MASPSEDSRGIDIVVETDIGKLFLQVKSSAAAARKFREFRGHRHIATVVVNSVVEIDRIRHRSISALAKERGRLLALRG